MSREERLASHKSGEGGTGDGGIWGKVAGSKSPSMSLWNKAVNVAKQAQRDDPDTNSSGEEGEGAGDGEENRQKKKKRMEKAKAMEIRYVSLRWM